MDVANAALALVDEDQEDAIHEFLDALADLYIEYIRRAMTLPFIPYLQTRYMNSAASHIRIRKIEQTL